MTRWDTALVARLTASDALTSSEREGENIHYVNDSENFSLAGLVLCSYEGLLFRLDPLKLLGPAGSSWGSYSCQCWTPEVVPKLLSISPTHSGSRCAPTLSDRQSWPSSLLPSFRTYAYLNRSLLCLSGMIGISILQRQRKLTSGELPLFLAP